MRAPSPIVWSRMIIWKSILFSCAGFITGWLLASWVCLFRRGETGDVYQQAWIEY